MKQLNRYYRYAKISERKTRQIIKYFALDLTANKTAELVAMTHQSVNRIFLKIRQRVAEQAERASLFASCEVEVDESYFGARRVKGKCGRGAGGKTKVFGIFKRNGSVYTEIVPECKKKTRQAVIRGRVSLDAVVHSDKWRGYDGLVDVGYKKHFRVNHSADEFVNGDSHINGIESFWSSTKGRDNWKEVKKRLMSPVFPIEIPMAFTGGIEPIYRVSPFAYNKGDYKSWHTTFDYDDENKRWYWAEYTPIFCSW